MIDKLLWINTDNTYPYKNLAIEEYLTETVGPGECILFLWQNRHTVVIGKNQNCWKECKVNCLEADGGYLVRRLSGGGAVFHDLGNLNFTFCVKHDDYNVDKQLDVILQAAKMLGIKAEKTGRNDITVDGRKFSGNAFLREGDQCYHHGTIMIDVNPEDLSKYLNVDKKKLESKGVSSVRSRVANLKEFRSDLTIDMMRKALIEAFAKVYGLNTEELKETSLPADKINDLTKKFESWDWKYGRKIPFDYEIGQRFDWGDIQFQIHVDSGIIKDINLFSDAMEQEVISGFKDALLGCQCNAVAMASAIDNAMLSSRLTYDDLIEIMQEDVKKLLMENF